MNALLTLPPQVGNKYLYKNKDSDELFECEITCEEECGDSTVWKSRCQAGTNWTYWPDGKAKTAPYGKKDYAAVLVEDIIVSHVPIEGEEIKMLRAKREEMMNRLKELGA
jgi:hypothetical protein